MQTLKHSPTLDDEALSQILGAYLRKAAAPREYDDCTDPGAMLASLIKPEVTQLIAHTPSNEAWIMTMLIEVGRAACRERV